MSTGTEIVKEALQLIGAHSVLQPAAPESIDIGLKRLKSMIETWLTKDINIGATPLDVVGDELNEPLDCRDGVIFNLAVRCGPSFDNGKANVSTTLANLARQQFQFIENNYSVITIPDKVISSTLPLGQGNYENFGEGAFFDEGSTIEN